MDYIAYLHKEKGSDFGVSFPDFPGCITAGRTLDEAKRLASEALAFHIDGMLEDGDPIPKPSSLDRLADDPSMKDAVAFLVTIELPDKIERFNISARRSQMAEIDRRAKREGLSRSAYIIAAALSATGSNSRPSRRVR